MNVRTAALLAVCCLPQFTGCGGAVSEMTYDGRTIVVRGGSSHSTSSQESGCVVQVDEHEIFVGPGQVIVDGEVRPIPDFVDMEICVQGEEVTVLLGGMDISEQEFLDQGAYLNGGGPVVKGEAFSQNQPTQFSSQPAQFSSQPALPRNMRGVAAHRDLRQTDPLRWYVAAIPDGSGQIRLPEGWRPTSGFRGAVDIQGPRGESLMLGHGWPVTIPQAAMNPATGELMGGTFILEPCHPVEAIQGIIQQLPRMSGQNIRLSQIIEAVQVPSSTGGQAAMVLSDVSSEGTLYRALNLVDCSPAAGGVWVYYSSGVAAPENAFATQLPTMLEIWKGWSVDPRVFQQRMGQAVASMRETSRLIRSAIENRNNGFEGSRADWTEVFRGTRVVEDRLTGERQHDSIGLVDENVRRHNEIEGYERYVPIPLRDE